MQVDQIQRTTWKEGKMQTDEVTKVTMKQPQHFHIVCPNCGQQVGSVTLTPGQETAVDLPYHQCSSEVS